MSENWEDYKHRREEGRQARAVCLGQGDYAEDPDRVRYLIVAAGRSAGSWRVQNVRTRDVDDMPFKFLTKVTAPDLGR